MSPNTDYLKINQDLWDLRVKPHMESDFYELDAFKAGKTSLQAIEQELLGDVRGKTITHLQCHFGLDSLSLARMGATVTGLDFSPEAITAAKTLTTELKVNARFVEANVYDAAECIGEPADLVFTTYGVLGWLPDLEKWARVVSDCLKPGGKLLLVEFHPFMWAFDDDFTKLTYSYFHSDPIVEEIPGNYTSHGTPIVQQSIGWNHSLAETYNALQSTGMRITHFNEYDYSPYPILKNGVQSGPRKWMFKGFEHMVPLVYSLMAEKPL